MNTIIQGNDKTSTKTRVTALGTNDTSLDKEVTFLNTLNYTALTKNIDNVASVSNWTPIMNSLLAGGTMNIYIPKGNYIFSTLPLYNNYDCNIYVSAEASCSGKGAEYINKASGQGEKSIHFTKNITDDYSSTTMVRNSNYTGGTPGSVNANLRLDTHVGANTKAFEWGLVSYMENASNNGENCAGYCQIKKQSNGPSWGFVSEAIDDVNIANPKVQLVGAEFDITANTTDENKTRVGVDVFLRPDKNKQQIGQPQGRAAFRANAVDSLWFAALEACGHFSRGIDFRNVRFENEAISLLNKQRIYFEGGWNLYSDCGALVIDRYGTQALVITENEIDCKLPLVRKDGSVV